MDEKIKDIQALKLDFKKERDFEAIENKEEKENLIKQYLLNLPALAFSNYKMLIKTLEYSHLCKDIKDDEFIFDPQFKETVEYIKNNSAYKKLGDKEKTELEVFFERQLKNAPEQESNTINEEKIFKLEGKDFFNILYFETQNKKEVPMSEEFVKKFLEELYNMEKEKQTPEFCSQTTNTIYEMFSEANYQEALLEFLSYEFVNETILKGIAYQIANIKEERDVNNIKLNIAMLVYDKKDIENLNNELKKN